MITITWKNGEVDQYDPVVTPVSFDTVNDEFDISWDPSSIKWPEIIATVNLGHKVTKSGPITKLTFRQS